MTTEAPNGNNQVSPARVVLIRHGESLWNRENRFTGWTDVELTDAGVLQATRAGYLLRAHGITFDVAFTSVLKRAIHTMWRVLDAVDLAHLPDIKSWRLNERHYGALQGLNKKETADQYGEEQVHEWRRSFATPPPVLDKDDPRHPRYDARYLPLPSHGSEVAGVQPVPSSGELPSTESLKDCVARTLPFWHDVVAPALKAGLRVLIVAHGNSLRGIVKHLDSISDKDIMGVEIPVATPLVYDLDPVTLRPLHPATYLGEPQVIRPPGPAGDANPAGTGKLATTTTLGLVTPASPGLASWLADLAGVGLARKGGILTVQATVGPTLPNSASIESVAGDDPPGPPSLGHSETSSAQQASHQEAKGPNSAGGSSSGAPAATTTGSIAAPPAGPTQEAGLATQPCTTTAASPAAAQAVSCLAGIATPVDKIVACVQHVKFVVIDACAVHSQIDLEAEASLRSAGLPGAAVALPPQGADMGDATGSAAGAEATTAGTAGTTGQGTTAKAGTTGAPPHEQGSGTAGGAGSLSRSSTDGLSECDHMGPTARHLAAELAGALDPSAHIVLVWSAPNSSPAPPPAAAYLPSSPDSSDKPAGTTSAPQASGKGAASEPSAPPTTSSAFQPAAQTGTPEKQQQQQQQAQGQPGKSSRLERSFSSREWVLCSMLDAVIKAQPGIKVLHITSSTADVQPQEGTATSEQAVPGTTSGPGPAPHGIQHMVCSLSSHVTGEDVRRVELMLMMTGRAVTACPSPGKHRPLAIHRHH